MSRILAALVGIATLGSAAAYFASLSTAERTALRTELQQAAVDSPEVAPLVKHLCPTCTVATPCAMRADGFLCRNGRLYGPGLGGVNADGSPATCTVQAEDKPWPCDGPSADWPEQLRALREDAVPAGETRDGRILRLVRERRQQWLDRPGGGP